MSANPSLAGLSVLVVDDHDESRDALAHLIQSCGATVSVAGNGRDGLEAAAANDPDVVLCDLQMPVLDGHGFLREFNGGRDTSRAPVIAISAQTDGAVARQCLDAGFACYLTKPLDFDALFARLAAIRTVVLAAREAAARATAFAQSAGAKANSASTEVATRWRRATDRAERRRGPRTEGSRRGDGDDGPESPDGTER